MGPSPSPRAASLRGLSICVLYGGQSSEREVSLTSGRCILEAFDGAIAAQLTDAPARVLGIELQADGSWRVGDESLTPGLALERLQEVDLFFLGLHGTDGEDGTLQGLLQAHGRRFTGSGVGGSAVAMDKELSRRVVGAAGLQLARGLDIDRQRWEREGDKLLEQLGAWSCQGWVVKPCCEGSSVGVSVHPTTAGLAQAIDAAFELGGQVLVEEFIAGTEVAAGVLERPGAGLEALPLVEICPKPGRFFDYEEKYSASGAVEHCPPKSVPEEVCQEVQRLALIAHRDLRCRGYSRSDFILRAGPNSSDAEPIFLETNTLPGMTPRSLLPLAGQAAGMDFYGICQAIALAALEP